MFPQSENVLIALPQNANNDSVREVFDRLRAAYLKLKPSKCSFAQQEVSFLGHIILSGGLKLNSNNTEK